MGAPPSRFLLLMGICGGLLVALPTAYYLLLKRVAGQQAEVVSVSWNPSHTCSVTTYFPSLGERTPSSRFFHFFSSPAFFRVHDARGVLLRSSEWHLFQNEADDEVPKWVGDGQVVYPITKGYEGWTLPECAGR
ncbi:hypothetical protein [Cystobacter ferrugineus]|uniref:Uncharacterized protein n=1 Tax=Cystobacter ferrugineus TaxID=83449 RepID=A0A1L9BKH4_9BACT|nr:hypothetical protein [Cystobacter ferrugineus]OJH42705.1 hypothetical protein BON30_05865 [Cystobacter ferrugineus]